MEGKVKENEYTTLQLDFDLDSPVVKWNTDAQQRFSLSLKRSVDRIKEDTMDDPVIHEFHKIMKLEDPTLRRASILKLIESNIEKANMEKASQ